MSERAWAWPVGIAVGLGFVVVANAVMITIALSHPSVPAANDHWAESLTWDQELEQRERSAALGWSIERIGWADADRQRVQLRLVDGDRRPLTGLRGTIKLERADSAAHDQTLTLRELGEGGYLADEQPATTGLVRLTLDVEGSGGERFVSHTQVELDALPVLIAGGAS